MKILSQISMLIPVIAWLYLVLKRERITLNMKRVINVIAFLSIAQIVDTSLFILHKSHAIDISIRILFFNWFSVYEYLAVGIMLIVFEVINKRTFLFLFVIGLAALIYLLLNRIGVDDKGLNYLVMSLKSGLLFIGCFWIIRVVDITHIWNYWGDIRLRSAGSFGLYFLCGALSFWFIEVQFFQLLHALSNITTNTILGVGLIWKTKSYLTHYRHLDFSLQS
jgi:hypothetical protein